MQAVDMEVRRHQMHICAAARHRPCPSPPYAMDQIPVILLDCTAVSKFTKVILPMGEDLHSVTAFSCYSATCYFMSMLFLHNSHTTDHWMLVVSALGTRILD